MKSVGKVLHLSSSGRLILTAYFVPKLGSEVLDDKLRVVGKVVDVLGPVSAPYIAVKPSRNYRNPQKLTGHELYIFTRGGGKKGRRWKR